MVVGCHGDICLGTSLHDRNIITNILHAGIDQYWIII